MEIGDLIQWSWYSATSGFTPAFEPEAHTTYRGIIVGERTEAWVRILIVVDGLGRTEVRADEARVISESR